MLPRAHDCITLLMGSRTKYLEFFQANPGTHFRSVGWVERTAELDDQLSGIGVGRDLNALIEKYGQDSGHHLYKEMLAIQQARGGPALQAHCTRRGTITSVLSLRMERMGIAQDR